VGDGSRGDAARGLQQLLVAFGQDIRADGIVGPKTIAALKAVQAQYELPQTDKLDAEGLAALLPLLLRNGQDKPE
jgi:lysozyme family protein